MIDFEYGVDVGARRAGPKNPQPTVGFYRKRGEKKTKRSEEGWFEMTENRQELKSPLATAEAYRSSRGPRCAPLLLESEKRKLRLQFAQSNPNGTIRDWEKCCLV